MEPPADIHIKGAREHNLRDIELRIPRDRMVVITGVSGSGKSSLAFDTLYAEGYRQYLDSLSPKVRALLDAVPRPDVDFIHGLSPVIAIEQRANGHVGPRATVATVSGMETYLRLLWTHAGEQFCPIDHSPIVNRSLDDCVLRILQEKEGTRAIFLAPLFRGKIAVLREELPRLRQRGFQRVRLDGEILELDSSDILAGRRGEATLDLVVDRVVIREDQRSRIADSLELAFREGAQRALVLLQDSRDAPWRELPLSVSLASSKEGHVYESLTPRHLSPNHPEGACPTCGGLGETLRFHEDLLVPDESLSVKKGALKPMRLGSKNMLIRNNALLRQLAEQLPFDADCPWRELSETVRQQILHGAGERAFSFRFTRGKKPVEATCFEGVVSELDKTFRNTTSQGLRNRLMAYQTRSQCPDCGGTRLNARARSVYLCDLPIHRFLGMSVTEAAGFVRGLNQNRTELPHAREALERLTQQLSFLEQVGLGYLCLDRTFVSLSGGEAQRVRLATQLGVGLTGVLYILDEPSIGLHAADHARLVETMVELRARGNAVIIVEHDEITMRQADHIIELGPGAGEQGGRVMFEGSLTACLEDKRSQTGAYLRGQLRVSREASLRVPAGRWLTVRGAREHNLRGIDVSFPVGLFTVVCGVSGSGKSTLVNDILANAAARKLQHAKRIAGAHGGIEGLEHFRSVIRVDQSPIGRSPRSNPATYVKLFDPLRQLFAKCPLSRIRGYTASRFSFNTRGGRCERCQGDGQIKLDMHFLDDVFVTCPSCQGKRYNRETLEVRFKGYSIADVLEMTIREARTLFRHQPALANRLDLLESVGLDYLRLGQPAHTLSGGEAQRIKLALELSKKTQGEALYILDEPTTGLHWEDVQRLLDLLFRLRDSGNTVILIEHHLDVLRLADWVIELGPGGGRDGGDLVFAGDVRSLIEQGETPTACFLKA